VVTVAEAIHTSEDKDKTGGPSYLAGLSQNTPSARNARRYAELVRARSLQRKLMQVGTEICESALRPGSREIGQIIDEAEGKVFALSERQHASGEGPKEISGLLSKVYERIDHLHNQDNPSDVTGVPTGFVDLDHMTSGLQPTDLVIIAGRPSMGKTALALNIIEHVAVKERLPVVLFSMEMSARR
jgi:replicative DNA helicase